MKKVFLFLLSLVGILSVQAQTSPYTGSEVGEGDFYLYNVETGYFLSNNNRQTADWNSHAELEPQGYAFGIKALDGGWKIDPYMGHNHSLNAHNFYMDTNDDVTTWTFETKTVEGVTNAYTIKSGDVTLGADADKFLRNSTENATWQLVSAAERLRIQTAKYAEASVENPLEITWMIPGANMSVADDRAAGLKITAPSAGAPFVDGQTQGNGVREIWSNNGAYNIGYTLNNLPSGKYRFTVSGYYRDGGVGAIGGKHDGGTEVIRPIIYANEKTQSIISICQRTVNGYGCDTSTGSYFVPNNIGNAAIATREGFYVNPGLVAIVSDGTLSVGIRAEAGVNDDWCMLDYFKLEYLGNDIDISEFVTALNDAIAAAEAFDASKTSDALKSDLETALNTAKATTSSTDATELGNATSALNAALLAAQGVDVSILKATAALAKKEGLDVTTAENLIATATENAPVTAMLETLRTARKIKALGGAPDIYKGAEPTADTEYYFYNLGTGMWLSAGSDWNTHAAVDQAGWLFKLNESGDGFTITSSMGSFNNSPYVDTGVNTVYKFQAVSVEGEEKIYNILEGSDLLGYNPDGKTDGKKYWNSVSNVAGADAADLNYQWKLVTKAERDALVAEATKTAPVDATYLISNPSLLRKPGYDMWSKEANGGNGGARVSSQDDGNGDRAADYGFEFWNSDSFKFSQKLEGLPAGIYELSVQGFWREGDGGNQSNIVNEGGALNQLAYVFANGEKALLPNIASCLDFVPGVGSAATNNGAFPNWPREAFEYFETGAYMATVKAIVGEDGELTIGVGVDEKRANGDWVVFDNFRLKYLGNDEAEIAYMRALDAIEDKGSYRIFTEVEGKKFYLTTAGKLVDSAKKAATFTFNKVAGDEYGYGFYVDGGGNRFSNPPGTNESNLKCGYISTSTNNRNTWEAQVFFQNAEGKFAVRATNVAGGATSGWSWVASSYWTVETANEALVAQYAWDPAYVWQIEANVDNRPAAWAKTQTWPMKFQQMFGLVQDATNWTTNAQEASEGPIANLIDLNTGTFFHSQWSGTGPDEDHYIEATLPEDIESFYISFTKRNNNNRPIQIDVTGGESETQTITEGLPADAWYTAAVNLTAPANVVRFTVPLTNMNEGANNGHKFFTFGEFYILPKNELITAAAPYMVGNDYTDLDTDPAIIEEIDAIDAKVSELAEYYAALAKIEDGAAYRIYTNVGETPYYLTADGKLTDDKTASGSFVFAKVEGEEFPYGFNLKDSYFTNPPQGGNPKLDNGQIATDPTSKRATWEAQVFFLKDGKYAVRATNAAGAESGWGLNATAFWTVNNGEDTPVAEYSFDKNYIWELEDMSTIKVTYVMFDAEDTQIGEPVVAVQEIGSEVKVPAEFLGAGYYAYTADKEGAVTEECTIKITRTYKTGLVMDLASLSNAKAYTITCDRGALLTKDDFLASTGHKSLTEAEPANFAIISYNENYYLYSVADQKFVTNTGALAAMPTNGEKDAIKMEAKDGWNAPYFMYYFTVAEGTNYGLNTNGNDPYGYVINSWMNADGGNMYYMIEAADFDATNAIAALDAYFNPSCVVTYIVKDAAGKELFTSEPEPAMMGSTITTLPAAYQRPFTTYNEVDVTIEAAETTIVFTATSEFPFELSSDFATAKWYNMTIRGEWWVGTEGKEDGEGIPVAEPYYPVQQTEDDAELLRNPAYQWAFTGDAYNGIIVWNKGAGAGFTLTSADEMAVMREGEYLWTIGQNSDGFTLRETGTEFNCINQNGGAGGPLSFWKSSGSLGDNGSTFRIFEVPAADPVEFTIKENMNKTGIGSGTQEAPTKVKINAPFKLQATAKNKAANNLQDEDLTIHFDMIMVSAFKDATWAPTGFNAVVLQDVNVPYAQYFEIPITFSEEYPFIQSINFVGAKLMKGDEVIDEVDVEEVGVPALVVRYIEIVDANGNSFVNDGIKSIFDENAENVFDLSGRKVQKVQKGRAYIIDGKKAVIRKK